MDEDELKQMICAPVLATRVTSILARLTLSPLQSQNRQSIDWPAFLVWTVGEHSAKSMRDRGGRLGPLIWRAILKRIMLSNMRDSTSLI